MTLKISLKPCIKDELWSWYHWQTWQLVQGQSLEVVGRVYWLHGDPLGRRPPQCLGIFAFELLLRQLFPLRIKRLLGTRRSRRRAPGRSQQQPRVGEHIWPPRQHLKSIQLYSKLYFKMCNELMMSLWRYDTQQTCYCFAPVQLTKGCENLARGTYSGGKQARFWQFCALQPFLIVTTSTSTNDELIKVQMDRFKCPRLRKPLFLSATLFGVVSTLSMVYVGQAMWDDIKILGNLVCPFVCNAMQGHTWFNLRRKIFCLSLKELIIFCITLRCGVIGALERNGASEAALFF